MTSVGAEGIDLQFCATLVNYDLNWNPMVLEQRIGRIDRIGQKKDEIEIYNLIVEGSIDERIIYTLGRKLGLLEGSVLEPSSILEMSSGHSLFLEDDFYREVRRAEALANAIELSSAVILEDYQLADLVDESFCSVGTLRRSANAESDLPWIKRSSDSVALLENIKGASARLKHSIGLYLP